jgi:hypothetical protein
VPRGTTAGEILREKGVLAILTDDEASSTDSDADVTPADLTARSSSSSSSSSARQQQHGPRSSNSSSSVSGPNAGQAQLARGAAGDSAPGMQQQQQVRLVNVNNRLVSEDTVLSDGDLVILARERIKI